MGQRCHSPYSHDDFRLSKASDPLSTFDDESPHAVSDVVELGFSSKAPSLFSIEDIII